MRYVLYNGFEGRYYGLGNRWVRDINKAHIFENRSHAKNFREYQLSMEDMSAKLRKMYAASEPLAVGIVVES